MIILDTNVLSNASRPRPDPAVAHWLDLTPRRETFTTAVTIAELRFGVARLPQGRRRAALHEYLEQGVVRAFQERILEFDLAASAEFAAIVASREKAGRPMDVADGMIAAIARLHGAVVATDRAAIAEATTAAFATGSDGTRPLVAVPTPGVRPELAVGDPVSLWATYDPSLAAGRPSTARLDTEATVASVSDDAVVVAVEADQVGEVVEATALATVTVVSERR